MTRVQIRVAGDLGAYGRSLFEGFSSMVEPVTTVLVGEVADDAELAALRRRIRDAGLELVGIRELSDDREAVTDLEADDITDRTGEAGETEGTDGGPPGAATRSR